MAEGNNLGLSNKLPKVLTSSEVIQFVYTFLAKWPPRGFLCFVVFLSLKSFSRDNGAYFLNHPAFSFDILERRITQELTEQKKEFQQKIVFRFRKKILKSCDAFTQLMASVQLAQDDQASSMLKKQIVEEQNWRQNAYVREMMMTSKPMLEKNKDFRMHSYHSFLKALPYMAYRNKIPTPRNPWLINLKAWVLTTM